MKVEANDAYERSLLDHFGLAANRYVLAVGRLVPEKSFHTLIDAYKAPDPHFKLVIAGRADHEDAYSRALLDHAGSRICFTGFQGQREIGALYRNASLFVLPSTHEGLPLAALEAASLGTPLLLSDIQANLDIGLPAQCYFPVGDVDALRHKLLQRHETYKVDPQWMAGRFDWSDCAAALRSASPARRDLPLQVSLRRRDCAAHARFHCLALEVRMRFKALTLVAVLGFPATMLAQNWKAAEKEVLQALEA